MESPNFHEKFWNLKNAIVAPVAFVVDYVLYSIKLMFRKYQQNIITPTSLSNGLCFNTCSHKRLFGSTNQNFDNISSINRIHGDWSLKSLILFFLPSPTPLRSCSYASTFTQTPTTLQNSIRSSVFYAFNGTSYYPELTDELTNNQINFVIGYRIESYIRDYTNLIIILQ